MKLFNASDSEGNLIKYDIREQKNYFPVRMCTIKNPYDFNNDALVNSKDVNDLIKHFGTRERDKDYNKKYDVNQKGNSNKRIDLLDLLDVMNESDKQEKLKKVIDSIS